MSHFYGQVTGNGRTPASRRGYPKTGIQTKAMSYNGVVKVDGKYNEDKDEDIFEITIADHPERAGCTRGDLVLEVRCDRATGKRKVTHHLKKHVEVKNRGTVQGEFSFMEELR